MVAIRRKWSVFYKTDGDPRIRTASDWSRVEKVLADSALDALEQVVRDRGTGLSMRHVKIRRGWHR